MSEEQQRIQDFFPDPRGRESSRDQWVPYPGEDLSCQECGSRNCTKVKHRSGSRRNIASRDMLRCEECGHLTDRWNRQQKGVE